MQAETTYAFFLDTSGSVGGSPNYWETVWELFSLYGNKVSHWYFWNSGVEPIDKKRFEKAITDRRGWNGTSPQSVAREIVNKGIKNLILVTDGEVIDHSVRACDDIMDKYKIEKSICYIISTGYGELNMSVTCPFSRNCESEVFSKKKGEPLSRLVNYTPEDYKILDSLDEITLKNFDEKYELIEGLIIALNMGKESNIPLKNQLVLMKKRLVKELSQSMVGEEAEAPGPTIRKALEKKDIEMVMKTVKKMNNDYFENDNTSSLEKKVSHLINLCGDLRGKYNLNEIKSAKMATAVNAVEGKIDQNVEMTDLSKNPIECPIILDEDIPQILIDECEPLLLGVEKHIVDDIAACPLRILNYPEIKDKFKARLSNYVGIKYGDKFLKNPFTQKKLLGAVPLGTHKSHVAVGNYTIAKMVSGGKVLGNLNMYYAVIWYLIKEGNIQFLKDVEKNAEEHLIFRLRSTNTMASLSGLAQFVTTEVPTDVAVWYCVNSGFFNQPTDRDTLRFHVFNIDPMIDMCKVLGYPLLKGTEEHIRRTKALFTMLSMVKKMDTPGKKSWKAKMDCLYQKGVKVNRQKITNEKFIQLETVVDYIPVDGEAEKDQIIDVVKSLPKNLQEVPVEELYYLSTKADAQKSASDIFLDFEIMIPELPKAQVNWKYGIKKMEHFSITVCPKTFRPLYRIGDQTWENQACQRWKMGARELFSGHKYFAEFIIKHGKLPNYDELLVFYFNRYIDSGKIKTLPFMMEQWAADIIGDYKEVLYDKKIDAGTFQSIYEGSMVLKIREAIEVGKAIEGLEGSNQYKKNYDFYFGSK